jgi:hypothetical protein
MHRHTRNMRRPSWHSCLRVSFAGCMQPEVQKSEGSRRRPARGDAVGAQNSLVIPHPAFLFLIFTNRPSCHQKVTTEHHSWNCGTRESTRELTEDSSGKPQKTSPVSPDRVLRRGDKLGCAARCAATLIWPEFRDKHCTFFLANYQILKSISNNYM